MALLQAMGETSPSRDMRKRLSTIIVRQSKWVAICQFYGSELLAFIPFRSEAPYGISNDVCIRLSDDESQAFHAHLAPEETMAIVNQLSSVGDLVEELFQNKEDF
jgi:hypothetical protein